MDKYVTDETRRKNHSILRARLPGFGRFATIRLPFLKSPSFRAPPFAGAACGGPS